MSQNDAAQVECLQKQLKIIPLLQAQSHHRGNLNAFRDENGNTLLHIASHIELVSYLIKAQENVNAVNHSKQTPLHKLKNIDGFRLLIANGADVNAQDMWGRTPLHYADGPDYQHIVSELLEAGANPYLQDKKKETPLDYCAKRHPAHCKILLTCILEQLRNELQQLLGEKLHAWDHSKDLYYTSISKQNTLEAQIEELEAELTLVQYLRSQHASDLGFQFQDTHGNTLLHIVRHLGVVRWLIAAGVDVNVKNNLGQTPLHICRSTEFAEALLKAGADVRSEDYLGKTALHYAMEADLKEIGLLLLEHRANPKAKDHGGKIPSFPNKGESIEAVLQLA